MRHRAAPPALAHERPRMPIGALAHPSPLSASLHARSTPPAGRLRALPTPQTSAAPPRRPQAIPARPHAAMQAASTAARLQFTARGAAARRPAARGGRLVVQAKVDLQGGPRIIRGKCFVTKDVSGDGQGLGDVLDACRAVSQGFRARRRRRLDGRLLSTPTPTPRRRALRRRHTPAHLVDRTSTPTRSSPRST